MKELPGQMDLWEGSKDEEGKVIRLPNYDTDLVVAMSTFNEPKYMSVDEMFDGFNDLKVVTYSYDLGFIEKISEKFETMTVLLGFEKIVGKDMRTMILASQNLSVKNIKQHKKLHDRALEGSATFKVAHDIKSHQKIYIMTAKDGRARVIVGSANFSGSGFSGLSKQGEVFVCYDNDEDGIIHFTSMFDLLNDFCMDEVTLETLYIKNTDDIEAQDLPVAKKVEENGIAIIVEQPEEVTEAIKYAVDASKLEAKYMNLVKEVRVVPGKRTDMALIVPSFITELTKIYREKKREKEAAAKRLPKLHYDHTEGTVSFDGIPYDLENISQDNVKNSLRALLEYFDGFGKMKGEVDRARKIYYKLMVYILAAPFIAILRYTANETGFDPNLLPYFAMIHGRESAGKTQFAKMMQYIMTGKSIAVMDTKMWTKTNIEKITQTVEGVPMCIDDISVTRFTRNADEIVKSDEWMLVNGLVNHPIYILTTNYLDSIDKPLRKRMYYVSVPVTMERVDASDGRVWLKGIRQRISLDLYKKYLSKMIPLVEDMINRMKTHDPSKDGYYRPDIFAISSNVILSMFEECGIPVPDYMTPLACEDYFGYNDDKDRVTEIVLLDWKHDKSRFKILRKQNELEYNAGEIGQDAKNITRLLPEDVGAKATSGGKVIMDLDQAEQYFGISFKKGPFS